MAQDPQADSHGERRRGTPGAFSRWMQHRMNGRMNRKVRRGRGKFMGMDVLMSKSDREYPVAQLTPRS